MADFETKTSLSIESNSNDDSGHPGRVTGNLLDDLGLYDVKHFVVSFAGMEVPAEGVMINPPQGGTLMVWPDGHYEFAGAESTIHDSSCVTCFAYVVEDAFGMVSAGTMELGSVFGSSHESLDFHGWILADLFEVQRVDHDLLMHDVNHVANEGLVNSVTGLQGSGHDLYSDSLGNGCDTHSDQGFTDVLTRMLSESQHS